nr:MAG TPA: hypothetical protein [Caudoviricetes sp.]
MRTDKGSTLLVVFEERTNTYLHSICKPLKCFNCRVGTIHYSRHRRLFYLTPLYLLHFGS